MMKKLVYIFMVILIISLGCKAKQPVKGKQPITKKPAATSPAAPAVVPQEEQKVEKEIYVYDPKDRRDPFTSLVQVTKAKPERKRGGSPVEDFDIDEIKLIAIASDNQQYYALITLPDKKSYTIRKGMTLGIYNGKVIQINRDSMLVREQIKDYRGQIKTEDTILKLRKEGEE